MAFFQFAKKNAGIILEEIRQRIFRISFQH